MRRRGRSALRRHVGRRPDQDHAACQHSGTTWIVMLGRREAHGRGFRHPGRAGTLCTPAPPGESRSPSSPLTLAVRCGKRSVGMPRPCATSSPGSRPVLNQPEAPGLGCRSPDRLNGTAPAVFAGTCQCRQLKPLGWLQPTGDLPCRRLPIISGVTFPTNRSPNDRN